MYLVRAYGWIGWPIVHEVNQKTSRPYCGAKLNPELWREEEDSNHADASGEHCERCLKSMEVEERNQ